MSLENTELNVGGIKLKGVYLALLITIVSSIGGMIWTASSVYSRLEAVEAQEIPNIEPLHEQLAVMRQQITDNGVPELQGKMAQLGTNIQTIIEQQQQLLTLEARITQMEQSITTMESTVERGEVIREDLEGYREDIDRLKREVEELWQGMDYLANPLK